MEVDMTDVLLLNADFKPIKAISWQKAVGLLLREKAYQVHDYAGKIIRSAKFEMAWPSVVALRKYSPMGAEVRLCRANIMSRDRYTCQYCGVRPMTKKGNPDLEELNLDHVVPQADAVEGKVVLPWSRKVVGISSWENLVCSCISCNSVKAARTPSAAGMRLLSMPHRPSAWEAVLLSLRKVTIPDEWRLYVPDEWKDYYEVDLSGE